MALEVQYEELVAAVVPAAVAVPMSRVSEHDHEQTRDRLRPYRYK